MKKNTNNQKGVALLLAIFLISFVFILLTGLLQVTTSDLQIAYNIQYRTRALFLAEAGIQDAIYQLANDNTWVSGFNNKSFANDTYSVVVNNNSDYTSPVTGQSICRIVNLTATGKSDNKYIRSIVATMNVSVTAEPPAPGSDQLTLGTPKPYNVMITDWKQI